VIVDRDPDDLTGSHQSSRQLDVIPARFELTAGMVVKNQNCGGPVVERSSEEIGRVDGRLGAGSNAEFVAANQPVPPINAEESEDLPPLDLEPLYEIVADDRRISEDLGFPQPGAGDPVTELETGEDGRRLGRTDSVEPEKLSGIPSSEFRQTTRRPQEGAGLDHRSPATPSGPHQDRQQLCVREDRRTEFEQTLARP